MTHLVVVPSVYVGVALLFAAISLGYYRNNPRRGGEEHGDEEVNVGAAVIVGLLWPAIVVLMVCVALVAFATPRD